MRFNDNSEVACFICHHVHLFVNTAKTTHKKSKVKQRQTAKTTLYRSS